MVRRTVLVLLALSTVCGVQAAHAKECQSVSFRDQTTVARNTLTLNGLGLRQATMLKVNV